MKKIFLSFTFLMTVFFGFSQEISGAEEKADKDYNGYSFGKAIDGYSEIKDSSITVRRNLADSYYKLGKSQEAEVLYHTIVNDSEKIPNDLYMYAEVLRQNKKYSEAEVWMSKYYELAQNDTRAIAYSKKTGSYNELLKDKKQFKITNLDINSPQEDFSPVFFEDKVLFASSREGIKSVKRVWNWNQLPFLDIYEANVLENNQLVDASQFNEKFNKRFHEGPVCFNSDQTKLVFTRNNYKSKSSEGLIRLELYMSELVEGKWTSPKPFTYNSNEYSVGHAAYSPDGKWLYFASDMPGGIGGVDLYKSQVTADGFDRPINLGNKINTEGNELFPSMHNGILFFASNGHIGLGGLDVFAAELRDDNQIGGVINLGAPVNTNKDDFSLSLHEDGKKGYFASNRMGGKGDDDIYSFDLLKPISFGKLIKGLAKDKKGNLIKYARMTLLDFELNELDYLETNSEGEFEFLITDGFYFTLVGEKEKYIGAKKKIELSKEDDDVIFVEIELEKIPEILLYGLVKDKGTSKPIEGVNLSFTDNLTGEKKEYITSTEGDFTRSMDEVNINDEGSYEITLQKEGYKSKTVTYNNIFDKEGRYEIHAKLDLSLERINSDDELSQTTSSTTTNNNSNIPNILKGFVRYEDGEVVAFERLSLINNQLKEIDFMETNAFGEFEFIDPQGDDLKIVGKHINSGGFEYDVVRNADGSFLPVEIELNKTSDEALMVDADLAKVIDINPIYFDFDKSNIRPDAAIELDKIVKVMNDNPNMVVEYRSHTDSRGSSEYNRSLSSRRAKSSAAYIKKRITNPERIYGKGFGESIPNKVNASQDGGDENQVLTEPFINTFKSKNRKAFDKYHQFNRRTEFVIIKM